MTYDRKQVQQTEDIQHLIAMHAAIKAAERGIKDIRSAQQITVEEAKKAVEHARVGVRQYGWYADCGESYVRAYDEAKSQLDFAVKMEEKLIHPYIALLKKQQIAYSEAKRKFAATFGEDALQPLYVHTTNRGKLMHENQRILLRIEKQRWYRITRLIAFFNGTGHGAIVDLLGVAVPRQLTSNIEKASDQIIQYEATVSQYIEAVVSAARQYCNRKPYSQVEYQSDHDERHTTQSSEYCAIARVKQLIQLDRELRSVHEAKLGHKLDGSTPVFLLPMV